jgi:hypothetical protein
MEQLLMCCPPELNSLLYCAVAAVAAVAVATTCQVRQAIASLQASLVEAEPQLQGCLLEPATAHLTIMVLNLPGQVRLVWVCLHRWCWECCVV